MDKYDNDILPFITIYFPFITIYFRYVSQINIVILKELCTPHRVWVGQCDASLMIKQIQSSLVTYRD